MIAFFERIFQKVSDWLKLDKRKKAFLRRMLPGIMITVAVVAVVLITVYHSTDGFTTLVDIEHASMVSERESMSFSAYMLKNEKVLFSQYPDGGVLYIAEDAERVNPDDPLAKLYSEPVNKSVEEKADFLDRCISILERSVGDGKMTAGESSQVKDALKSMYYKITQAIATGDASVISANADEYLVLLNRIQSNSDNGEALKALLEEYKLERRSLEESYKGSYTTMTVGEKESGYFFRDIDGYESVYSSADIANMTYDDFIAMTQMSPSETTGVGKILLDYNWYLSIPTVKGISDTYVIGQTYDVSFPDSDNRTLKMTLSNIIYDDSGANSLMLFSCGIVDSSFNYLRIQRVNIVSRDISGFRIPEKAVCELNGTTGVYILKDGMASFRKIVILYEGDGYYIVSSESSNSDDYHIYIELNDSIITDCKNMYEGKVIE